MAKKPPPPPRPMAHLRACRNEKNRVCGMTIPIIFVPGIMGSRFDIPSQKDKWDADSTTNMLGWAMNRLKTKRRILDFANAGPIIVEPLDRFETDHDARVARGFGGMRWKSYGPLLEFLERFRCGGYRTPVYTVGYDWRQPVSVLGERLVTAILGGTTDPAGVFDSDGIMQREPDAKHCVIVTHSMGGLVARMALKNSGALQGKVLGVLHGVQPATGAPVMFRRLITGAYAPYDGSATEDKALQRILGREGQDFGTLVSVIPGAVHLAPSNLYRDALARKDVSWISYTTYAEDRATVHGSTASVHEIFKHTQEDEPPGGMHTKLEKESHDALLTRLSELETFHKAIGDWKFEGKTWAFYGNQHITDVSVHFDLPDRSSLMDRAKALLPGGVSRTSEPNRGDERNGFNPNPPGMEGKEAGWSAHGDGTVPAASGAALFDASKTMTITDLATLKGDFPFDDKQQYEFAVEHEPAYKDAGVQAFTAAWLEYMCAGAPRD